DVHLHGDGAGLEAVEGERGDASEHGGHARPVGLTRDARFVTIVHLRSGGPPVLQPGRSEPARAVPLAALVPLYGRPVSSDPTVRTPRRFASTRSGSPSTPAAISRPWSTWRERSEDPLGPSAPLGLATAGI